jgi:hypothetical protein
VGNTSVEKHLQEAATTGITAFIVEVESLIALCWERVSTSLSLLEVRGKLIQVQDLVPSYVKEKVKGLLCKERRTLTYCSLF